MKVNSPDHALGLPLAEILRPTSLDDIIGQEHLLGPGKPLRIAFESKKPHSMILWGPPGVGKTTLARLTARSFDCEWIALSAVFSGVKDIRAAIDTARHFQENNRQTILFIDEIHRFNKSQQDALLPFTESGLITFIGATTENPSFEVNSALLSRSHVYVLKSLSAEALKTLLLSAQKKTYPHLHLEEDSIETFIAYADGDARRLLNSLEQVTIASSTLNKTTIDKSFVLNTLASSLRRFDKGGDQFYDQISALHKSVRGSNPDAALYWFCRMLDGGVDLTYLKRRIIRMAWEDIGLADPRAMQLVNDAASTYERLGSPEGDLALAQAVLYLAVAPKSNAGYSAFNKACAFIKKDKTRDVPMHLRNAPNKLLKNLGHSQGYRYAHDEPDGFSAGENYYPDDMAPPDWYKPVKRGLEIKIGEKMDLLRKRDAQAQ